MVANKDIYKDLIEDSKVKKEIKKLTDIFKEIPEDKKQLVNKLIENAGFMAVLLEKLQEDMKTNGYKEKYQNGKEQWGYKRSISADLYQVTIKNYSNTIKQLTELLPKENSDEFDDGFEEFINSKG